MPPSARPALAVPLLWLTLAAGCDAQQTVPQGAAAADRVRETGALRHPRLTEASAAAASRRQPGVYWTLNDSGNDPWIFAFDSAGRDLGAFRVTGAENRDWEELSVGPCVPGGPFDCLYIGDIGDNQGRRRQVTLYRIPEPAALAVPRAPLQRTAPAETMRLRYPGGGRDAEAMFVDARGIVHLVTKGREGVVEHYRVPFAPGRREPAVAERVEALPIAVGGDVWRLVGAASLAADGLRVALRSYVEIRLFRLTPEGRLVPEPGVPRCGIAGLQRQGEGLAWAGEHDFLLTSERDGGGPAPVLVVHCPGV